ncbi:hypothetical protein A2U01_0089798, partial [Trifolium medium]|nr:hypothetical protein [Trifolium medium]
MARNANAGAIAPPVHPPQDPSQIPGN